MREREREREREGERGREGERERERESGGRAGFRFRPASEHRGGAHKAGMGTWNCTRVVAGDPSALCDAGAAARGEREPRSRLSEERDEERDMDSA